MKASEIIELQKYEKSGNFYPLYEKTLQAISGVVVLEVSKSMR
jgi:hypothetical protein